MFRRLLFLLTLLLTVLGLAACDSSGYRKQRGRWLHGDTAFTPADPATFEVIDRRFARDARRGYYRGSEIADSDGATFAVVAEHEARDRHHVYYCDTDRKAREYGAIRHLRIFRIEGADPQTYRSLGQGYARDRHRVYAGGTPIEVHDAASFEPLGGAFARDARRGYFANAEIHGSDGRSFAMVDERDLSYARDRDHGYHAMGGALRVLRGADPASLRVLGRGYARDARHVWHRGTLLADADVATFMVEESYVGPADATDRSGAWYDGQRRMAAK